MTKKAIRFLALMTALVFALTGCSMIEVDEEKQAAQAALTVNGTTLSVSDLQSEYDYYVYYYYNLYTYYGLTTTIEDCESMARDAVLNAETERLVLADKAKELGIDQFDEETEAQFQTDLATNYQSLLDSYAEAAGVTDEMTDEERKTAIETYLATNYNVTPEKYEQDQRDSKIAELVKAYAIKDVAVDDAEIQAAYDAKVASDETTYSASAYSFETAMSSGATVAWIPEGYRTVLHILLKYTDEQATEITSLNTELSEIETKLTELENADAEPDAEATAAPETEATAEPEAEATAEPETKESLTARKTEIETRLTELQGELLAAQQATIDEIKQKMEDGADFRELILAYSADTGMTADEPSYETGYYVSANSTAWDANFTAGAMALTEIGQLSEPVYTSYGIHLIYYLGDATPGAVPLENVRDAISADALTEKQSTVYDETYQTWLDAAKVKSYPDRLVYSQQ